jgi:carboxymethylenebutenolidase
MAAQFHPDVRNVMPPQEFSRRELVVTALASGFALAARPINAASVISTDSAGLTAGEIKIPTADVQLPGYRAMPARGSGFPTVLVVQEVFGVHEHIKDLCRRFAKLGYFAITAELYARQGDVHSVTDIKALMPIVQSVPDAQVMSDLDACVAYARASGKANTSKLAITGFCWGGRIVWLYAAHNADLKAGAAWYGRLIGDPTELQPHSALDVAGELKAPVIGFYGGKDRGITPESIEQMRAALENSKFKYELAVFPDAEHGFNADYRSSYNAEDAKAAWQQMLDWFKQFGAV